MADKLKLGIRLGYGDDWAGPIVYDRETGRELDQNKILQPVEIGGISEAGDQPYVTLRIAIEGFEIQQK